ncbi:MAG: SDR family oxidoreductase [Bryobacteraceae bacterium]|jgi:short-subunit dehydrogenase
MGKGTALITGASSGIGAELAKLCAADGYDVVLVARQRAALEDLAFGLSQAHGIAARAVIADLADPAAARAVFDSAGAVDILINNAGFGLRGAYAGTDWEAEARMIQVNITALAHLTKLYLPGMIARRKGRILNVASTAAFVPGPFMAMYYATKAFVFSFSLAIANELQGTGVTLTVLCPGPTRTNFFETAGTANTKIIKGPSMTAAAVAREGYRAMLAGRAEIIAGGRNRWMIWGARFAPRRMLAGIARRLNSPA